MYQELTARGELDIAEENFDYHFRLLRKTGFISQVDEEAVRGSRKVTFLLTEQASLDDSTRMSLIAEALSKKSEDPNEALRRIRWIVTDSGREIKREVAEGP